MPVAILTSGLGTLIYQFCTKRRSPVYLGSSFAFIAPVAAAHAAHGFDGAMTGILAVSIIYVVAAALVMRIGTAWIDRLLPPVVTGPMIMIIGLSLAGSAVSQIGINAGATFDVRNLFVATITLVSAIAFMVGFRKILDGFLNVVPFLAAIIVGYFVACCLRLVDFTPVREAAWIQIPKIRILGLHYHLDFRAVLTVAPLALATLSEHIGDHKALSSIVEQDLLQEPGLGRTLLGDGIATGAAALLGGPANTTYGENTAIIGMTHVASVNVITLAAVFAIILSCIGKFTAAISTIPNAVLGGVSILLYGFIALNGAKEWVKNQIDFNVPRNVAISATMLVLGLGGAVISVGFGITFSGMSLAAIVGVIMNQLIPEDPKSSTTSVEQTEH